MSINPDLNSELRNKWERVIKRVKLQPKSMLIC